MEYWHHSVTGVLKEEVPVVNTDPVTQLGHWVKERPISYWSNGVNIAIIDTSSVFFL